MASDLDYDEIFDWTREPRDERERKIRKKWLDRQLERPLGGIRLADAGLVEPRASDLEEAIKESKRREAETQRLRNAAELNEIASELEREGDL